MATPLTRREHEIAKLVGDGLRDREIAKKLFLAPRTVEWHLEQIRAKLDFGTRAQIAAWVARNQPSDASEPMTGRHSQPNNLPLWATSFVGRAGDLAAIKRLLSGTRLLTLTGVAGVGKTRLAVQAAADGLERFPDGSWFIDLSPIADPELVARTVCEVMAVRPGPDEPVLDAVAERLRDSCLLLLLDNCEHLVEGCARLADRVLRSCSRVSLLATSRESLHVDGETTWRVRPLNTAVSPGSSESEAETLFVERAQKVAPENIMGPESRAAVSQICSQLDGIPLAIEMAAARVGMMSPEQILARLEDRFRLLTGGTRLSVSRHQTLKAALDWSHTLLSEDERKVLRRLSVFAGGFTLESAEAVASGPDVEASSVLDLLARLVDKSLVVPVRSAGAAVRYHMLMTVQEFGRERLLQSGEAASVRDAHLKYFLSLAEEAEPRLLARSPAAMDRVEVEIDNLRLAMAWARSSDVDAGLRMAIALDQFWLMRSRFSEGYEALTQILASDGGDPTLRLHAAAELALLCGSIGDAECALHNAELAIALGEKVGECGGLARALGIKGNHALWRRDLPAADRLYKESLRIGSQFSLTPWQYYGRRGLTQVAFMRGDTALGRRLGAEMLQLWSEDSDAWTHCWSRLALAYGEFGVGNLEASCLHLEVVLRTVTRSPFNDPGSHAVRITSQIEFARGRHDSGLRLAGASMSLRNHYGFGLYTSRAGEVWPPATPVPQKQAVALVAEGEAMSAAEAYEQAQAAIGSAPPVE